MFLFQFGMDGPLCCMIMEILYLTHKQLEIYGCVPSAIGTDALVLKYQDICIHDSTVLIKYSLYSY